METEFETAQLGHAVAGEITVAPTSKLRDPNHESMLAQLHRNGAASASAAHNRITYSILDHHDAGGIVMTANRKILDIERMETRGEPFVFDTDGKLIVLEQKILPNRGGSRMGELFHPKELTLLTRPEDSFGASPRRTMNRFFEKADKPSTRCVDGRLLSMMFWADASMKIVGMK
jgi:hypothetical protein